MLFGVSDEDWKDVPYRILDIACAYNGDATIHKDPVRGWVAVAEDGHVLETMWGLDPDVWSRDVPAHVKKIVTDRGGGTTIRHSDVRGWIVYADDHTTLFAERGDPEYKEAVLVEKWWLAELMSPSMTGARHDLVTVLLGGKSPEDEAFGPCCDGLHSAEEREHTKRDLNGLNEWLLAAPEWFRRRASPIAAAWRSRVECEIARIDAETLRLAPYRAIQSQWILYRFFRAKVENNLGEYTSVCAKKIPRHRIIDIGLSARSYAEHAGICSPDAKAAFDAVRELGRTAICIERERALMGYALAGFRALRKARTAKRAADAMVK